MRLKFVGEHGSGPVSVTAKKEVDEGEPLWADVKWWPENDYRADVPEWLGEYLLKQEGGNWEQIGGELLPLPVPPTGDVGFDEFGEPVPERKRSG